MCGIFCVVSKHPITDLNKMISNLSKLSKRGPDQITYKYYQVSNYYIFFGFARLSIMDLSSVGMQPFELGDTAVICNGEIYNYREIRREYTIDLISESDCEVILPLYRKIGFRNMLSELDAEFAMVLLNLAASRLYAARDRYGVRPLFYGYTEDTLAFASEMKALTGIGLGKIYPLKPNYILSCKLNTRELDICLTKYYDYSSLTAVLSLNIPSYIQYRIQSILTESVKKRLVADREIGFLLSGGLDSSLIVSIATKLLGPDKIVCFSIGLPGSPDVEAAKKVVEYLSIKNHHIIEFDVDRGFESIPEVIEATETYDITTIRASVPQYLMAKYISENTNIKVILSGEGSDEIHGSYRYFRDAPNMIAFHQETVRLLEELYLFDNLRTDRTMASFGMEVRVPFLDYEYVEFIKSINPELLMNSQSVIEKKIIRDSFEEYLPNDILYRSKEAFSDAVSSNDTNWYRSVQNKINDQITNEQFDTMSKTFAHNQPQTKEAMYYRSIFERYYPNQAHVIPHFWLPKFQKEKIIDPSATILPCY